MYNGAVNIAGIQYVLLDKSSLVNTCHLSSVLKVGFFFFFLFLFSCFVLQMANADFGRE